MRGLASLQESFLFSRDRPTYVHMSRTRLKRDELRGIMETRFLTMEYEQRCY